MSSPSHPGTAQPGLDSVSSTASPLRPALKVVWASLLEGPGSQSQLLCSYFLC